MKKNNQRLKTYLFIALISIVSIGIAYAALSTTLSITFGNVTQTKLTWAVAFDTSGSPVSGTSSGTSSTGLSCGNATVTANSVTVADTSLSKPGDKCTWTLTIKNTGSIDATLGTIAKTNATGTNVSCTTGTANTASLVCGNITYLLTTDSAGSTPLTTSNAGTLAKTSGTKTVYLVAKYTPTDAVQSTAITQTGAGFTLTWNQK